MDPHKILRISKDSTPKEIRAAYRKMAAKYHPDVGGDAWVFQQVQAAYKALTDPKKRRRRKKRPPPDPPVRNEPKTERSPDPSGFDPSAYDDLNPKRTPDPAFYGATATTENPTSAPEVNKTSARARVRNRKRNNKVPYNVIGIVLGGLGAILVAVFFLYLNGRFEKSSESVAQAPPATIVPPNKTPPLNPPPRQREPKPKNRDADRSNIDKPPERVPDNGWKSTIPIPRQPNRDVPGPVVPDAPGPVRNVPWPERPPGNRALSLTTYISHEKQYVFVDKILEFYKYELERVVLEDETRKFINDRIEQLSKHPKQLLIGDNILVDSSYWTTDELTDARNQSNELIAEWYEMVNASKLDYESTPYKEAEILIKRASDIDPVSFRADFYLGLACVLITRDYEKAEQHFEDCAKRGRRYRVVYNESDSNNFAGVLINLGLLRIRNKPRTSTATAYDLWKESLTYNSVVGPELGENVQNVVKLIGSRWLKAPASTVNDFRQWELKLLKDKIITSISGSVNDWYYAPWVPHENESMPIQPQGVTDYLRQVVGDQFIRNRN